VNYTYSQYLFYANYLANNSTAFQVGGNASLPVRFPALGISPLVYLDDQLPKVGFVEIQSALNSTWLWIYNNIIIKLTEPCFYAGTCDSIQSSAIRGSALGINTTDAAFRAYQADLAAWHTSAQQRATRPMPVAPAYTTGGMVGPDLMILMNMGLPIVQRLGDALTGGGITLAMHYTRDVAEGRIVAQDESLSDIFIQWFEFFFGYVSCNYTTAIDGTNMRVSVLQAVLIFLVPYLLVAYVLSQIPALGALGMLVGTAVLGSGGLIFLWLIFSTATSWALLCNAALPQALFSVILPNLLFEELIPQCPWYAALYFHTVRISAGLARA